ncbi:MAG TPA: DMT family transporter [Gaiella sp.]|nr:DMT family transporter [Gaiella sp.]
MGFRVPAAPIVVAVLVMVVWGATPILTRIALEDMEPLVVATLRTIVAGLLAVPLLAHARLSLPRAATSRRLLAISAAAGFVVFPVVYTIGQERTSGLHGVMILAALPIFTGLYAAAVARRPPTGGWLVGCAIALAGEVVLIGARGGDASDATLGGDLLVLAAALVVSAGYVAGAMLPPRGVSSAAATYWGVVLGAVVLAPLATALLARDGLPEAGWRAWGAVAVLAVVTSVVGYIGWYWALDRGGIARISTLQFLQPLSGFALAVVVLGDSVTPTIAVGAAAIVCGVIIAQRA